MELERSFESLELNDLAELLDGSLIRLREYFYKGIGIKWLKLYDIQNPIVVALCQGAAMHYFDKKNGIKDFDVWFFYPFNKEHLPYRTIWCWDYTNPKFGRHPSIPGYNGRKVDVIVRSIHNYSIDKPRETIYNFLENEGTKTSIELAKKAVVILKPKKFMGNVVWYKNKI